MTLVETFDRIAKTARQADKKELILSLDQELVRTILADTYDRNRTYGITTRNLSPAGPTAESYRTIDTDYAVFHELLEKLARRELTGNAAIDEANRVLGTFCPADRKLLLNIVDRTIAIGFTYDAYQKLTGRKEAKFEVPLALHLNKTKGVDPVDGTYYASHKLDGVRLLTKVDLDNKEIKFYSRSGKEYGTLDNLKAPIFRILAGRTGVWAIDGECCDMKDGVEDFQGIMKQVTRKNYTIPDPHYCIFDLVTWAVFMGEETSPDFTSRYADMKKLPKDEHIILLEQEKITSQEVFDRWAKRVADNDWEGFMLRKDAPFRKGRSKDLLKYKPYVEDFETRVIRVVNGIQNFAVPGEGVQEFEGVKDLVIRLDTGDEVRVGSGLTKEQRIEWFKHPERIIGKMVTIKYLEETIDKNGKKSLRHPSLKWAYTEGDRDI